MNAMLQIAVKAIAPQPASGISTRSRTLGRCSTTAIRPRIGRLTQLNQACTSSGLNSGSRLTAITPSEPTKAEAITSARLGQ